LSFFFFQGNQGDANFGVGQQKCISVSAQCSALVPGCVCTQHRRSALLWKGSALHSIQQLPLSSWRNLTFTNWNKCQQLSVQHAELYFPPPTVSTD